MATIGFLHTSSVHVATFDELVRAAGGAAPVHVVDEALLDDARHGGVGTPTLADGVRARLAEVRAGGADLVICTCSTIGGLAEKVGAGDVWRVDRPAARRAVTTGERVGVVVAVESTVGPTRELVEEESRSAGLAPVVEVVLADGAWQAWEAGETATYLALVAGAAEELARRSDVVLLAQASMAGASVLLAELRTPVLTTPASAVEWALGWAQE